MSQSSSPERPDRASRILLDLLALTLPVLILAFQNCSGSPNGDFADGSSTGGAAMSFQVSPAAPKIYYGESDNPADLVNSPAQWTYVQQHADGLYVTTSALPSGTWLASVNGLLTQRNAFYQTDLTQQNQAGDAQDLSLLQQNNFSTSETSLSDGWDSTRAQNLASYALLGTQAARPTLLSQDPAPVGGDVSSDATATNATVRSGLGSASGLAVDGALGTWSANANQVQSGSYSMVNYAHGAGKVASVLLSPYGAGVGTYTSTTDYLATGINCVQSHEDNNAEPDVWSVYGVGEPSLPALPEQNADGSPAISTAGMAYYLLKHRDGDPGTMDLYATLPNQNGKIYGQGVISLNPSDQAIPLDGNARGGYGYHYKLYLSNSSAWLDYAAVLQAANVNGGNDWLVQVMFGTTDITAQVFGSGFQFYQTSRLNANSIQSVDVYFTRSSIVVAQPAVFNFQLLPHHGSAALDLLQFFSQQPGN